MALALQPGYHWVSGPKGTLTQEPDAPAVTATPAAAPAALQVTNPDFQAPETAGKTLGQLGAKYDTTSKNYNSSFANYLFGAPDDAVITKDPNNINVDHFTSAKFANTANTDIWTGNDKNQGDAYWSGKTTFANMTKIYEMAGNALNEKGYFLPASYLNNYDARDWEGNGPVVQAYGAPKDLGQKLKDNATYVDVPGMGTGFIFNTWQQYTDTMGDRAYSNLDPGLTQWSGGKVDKNKGSLGDVLKVINVAMQFTPYAAAWNLGYGLASGVMNNNPLQALGAVVGASGIIGEATNSLTDTLGGAAVDNGLQYYAGDAATQALSKGIVTGAANLVSTGNPVSAVAAGVGSGIGSEVSNLTGSSIAGSAAGTAINSAIQGGDVGEATLTQIAKSLLGKGWTMASGLMHSPDGTQEADPATGKTTDLFGEDIGRYAEDGSFVTDNSDVAHGDQPTTGNENDPHFQEDGYHLDENSNSWVADTPVGTGTVLAPGDNAPPYKEPGFHYDAGTGGWVSDDTPVGTGTVLGPGSDDPHYNEPGFHFDPVQQKWVIDDSGTISDEQTNPGDTSTTGGTTGTSTTGGVTIGDPILPGTNTATPPIHTLPVTTPPTTTGGIIGSQIGTVGQTGTYGSPVGFRFGTRGVPTSRWITG